MRLLYVTTIGETMDFFKSFIKQLIDDGNTVDIATNETGSKVSECYREWGCTVHHIDTSRSPLNIHNLTAVKQLTELVSTGNYDLVHCHTPIAAACTRVACRKVRKRGTKVLYTAHGFHFYKGAPLKNWMLFYPIEKLCARWTDVLITINKQDYARAKKRLPVKTIYYIPGVGINLEKFSSVQIDRKLKRESLGIPKDAFMMLSVGELNENKNHQVVLHAIAKLKDAGVHYAIAGIGDNRDVLLRLAAQLGIAEQVHLLGYRTDVAELYKAADVFVHPSLREGLPVSIMEARAAGVPVVCSDIRGNADLVSSAFRFRPQDSDGLIKILSTLSTSVRTCDEDVLPAEHMDSHYINAQLSKLYADTVGPK